MRNPAGGKARSCAASPSTERPASTRSTSAQHATPGAMAPIESSVVERGNAPFAGTRDAVGLKPVRPQNAAGMRNEPPVSLPRPAAAMPNATDIAAPDDEPPATRASPFLPSVHGERGVPYQ